MRSTYTDTSVFFWYKHKSNTLVYKEKYHIANQMYPADNSTSNAPLPIKNDLTRGFLAFLNLTFVISTLVGESFILSAIQHNAIKLHRVVVTVMQHLSICDILLSLLWTLPTVISLSANHWIMGDFLCSLQLHVGNAFSPAASWLTCFLTISKSLTIRFPLRARSWSRRAAHAACALLWIKCFISPNHLVLFYLLANPSNYPHLDFVTYSCIYDFDLIPQWLGTVINVWVIIFVSLLWFLLISGTVYLSVQACRGAAGHQRDVPWQGILTIIITAACLLVSFMPYVILKIVDRSVTNTPYVGMWRMAVCFQNFRMVTNFYVYFLTVKSFRDFVKARFGSAVAVFCCKSKVHP